MLDNIKEVIRALKDGDIPSLVFNGGKHHPFNIIIYPVLAVGAILIFSAFTAIAVVIDFFNFFVKPE